MSLPWRHWQLLQCQILSTNQLSALLWPQNNNLERALDWIFTHPDCEDESVAMSDTPDTEPNDNSFSNTNANSDSLLSPDQEAPSPRVRDGPGRKCLLHTALKTHVIQYIKSNECCFLFVSHIKGYELFAFISHMGTSTMSGHYVCHIKKEGRYADPNILIIYYIMYVCFANVFGCKPL